MKLYPWSDGSRRPEDPTYGKIDHDIQWHVDRYAHVGLSRRAAHQATLQDRRDLGGELALTPTPPEAFTPTITAPDGLGNPREEYPMPYQIAPPADYETRTQYRRRIIGDTLLHAYNLVGAHELDMVTTVLNDAIAELSGEVPAVLEGELDTIALPNSDKQNALHAATIIAGYEEDPSDAAAVIALARQFEAYLTENDEQLVPVELDHTDIDDLDFEKRGLVPRVRDLLAVTLLSEELAVALHDLVTEKTGVRASFLANAPKHLPPATHQLYLLQHTSPDDLDQLLRSRNMAAMQVGSNATPATDTANERTPQTALATQVQAALRGHRITPEAALEMHQIIDSRIGNASNHTGRIGRMHEKNHEEYVKSHVGVIDILAALGGLELTEIQTQGLIDGVLRARGRVTRVDGDANDEG